MMASLSPLCVSFDKTVLSPPPPPPPLLPSLSFSPWFFFSFLPLARGRPRKQSINSEDACSPSISQNGRWRKPSIAVRGCLRLKLRLFLLHGCLVEADKHLLVPNRDCGKETRAGEGPLPPLSQAFLPALLAIYSFVYWEVL